MGNWAVGTIIGIWGAETGIIGATGRDQVTSMVALYGPRTTMFVALDDGLYEFTYGANDVDGWICSRERIQIAEESKIFSPANMRAAQDVEGYSSLIDYWMSNRYTLRYSGGLVPDVCQQFTKKQGVSANPTSKGSPANSPCLRGGAVCTSGREGRWQDLGGSRGHLRSRRPHHGHRPAYRPLHRLR